MKDFKWWELDMYGYPIEICKDKPFSSAIRIILQNIRKITG